MKSNRTENINWLLGWLCGAVFLAAPVVAVLYLLRHRRRPAFQAMMICVLALPCIIGARYLMLTAGIQHKTPAWMALNAIVFLVFPLLATGITSAIPWPRPGGHRSGGSRASRKASQPARTT